jgi:hypothetical protein
MRTASIWRFGGAAAAFGIALALGVGAQPSGAGAQPFNGRLQPTQYSSPARNWNESVPPWAVGTFRGQNSGNGSEELITIRPDGSAELRSRDRPPVYGTFAGETLTLERRMSRVQPARGGIVIDGAYYSR